MTKIEELFGIDIKPEQKSPAVNFDSLEENIRNHIRKLKNYDPDKFNIYLYTLRFNFPTNEEKALLTKLKTIICRLRIPAKEYKEDKMLMWNHLLPTDATLVKLKGESGYHPYDPSLVKINSSVQRIVYTLSEYSIRLIQKYDIQNFTHRILLSVNTDVPKEHRIFKIGLTCIPTDEYCLELSVNGRLGKISEKEVKENGIKSSHTIELIQDQQVAIFEDDSKFHIKNFHAYMAYATPDKIEASIFHRKLENLKVNVWFSERDLKPGTKVMNEISNRITAIPVTIVAIGKSGIGPWMEREIEIAIHNSIEKNKMIMTVFLPNAPQNISIPEFLKRYSFVDLRLGYNEQELIRITDTLKQELNNK